MLSRGSVPVSAASERRAGREGGRQTGRPFGLHARGAAWGRDSVFSDRLRQPDYLAPRAWRRFPHGRRHKTHGFAPLPRDRFAFIVCNRLTPKIVAGAAGKDI